MALKVLQGSSASRRRRCGGRVGTSGAGFQLRQNVARRLTEPSLQSRALRSTCSKSAICHSQVPLRLPSGLQPTARCLLQPKRNKQRERQRACSDTPLPIWCMKLPLAPCPSHEREMQVRVGSGAHWNSHGKFDFRLGKVQLACARHARWLAALAAIDAQPTATVVALTRRRFS